MPEHFTKTTVEAKFWCAKHGRPTMHFVFDGRRGACKECIAEREAEAAARKAKQAGKAEQKSLF